MNGHWALRAFTEAVACDPNYFDKIHSRGSYQSTVLEPLTKTISLYFSRVDHIESTQWFLTNQSLADKNKQWSGMSAKRFSDKFKVNLLLLCKLQKLMPVILCIISFLTPLLLLVSAFLVSSSSLSTDVDFSGYCSESICRRTCIPEIPTR